ncbi:hypothetical protein D6C87_00174 [Aureobasidium pullulans]|uniref:ribonuclease Z n=1 Tax=Aureobasidium pullulans TaxID=5580 RepID=A0AB38MBJ8_AURPU|nr:hypothetical protein D6C94_01151 [Aureobasidium pullulans]THZ49299.1 hypothetical protein D6C87_00174 [Aureobasidium pullulans]
MSSSKQHAQRGKKKDPRPVEEPKVATNLASLRNLSSSVYPVVQFQRRAAANYKGSHRAARLRLEGLKSISADKQAVYASDLVQGLFTDHRKAPEATEQHTTAPQLQALRGLLHSSTRSQPSRSPKLRSWDKRPSIIFPPSTALDISPKLRSWYKRPSIIFPPSTTLDIPKGGSTDDIQFRKMRSFFQFVTTPTADTPGTTLLLHFDNKRYLIGNIAEGTQRASIEQKVRLLKVSEIFLTGNTSWEKTGGLIGMILTLADAAASSAQASLLETKKKLLNRLEREGVEINEDDIAAQAAREVKDRVRLSIFGGPNLNYTLATARRFVFRKGMPVDVHEYGHATTQSTPLSDPTWSDDNVQVWALPVSPSPKTSSGSSSPRKRSYDELNGREILSSRPSLNQTDKERALMMSKSVVSEMFDSSWRMDALVETPINQVQMPATLFVRNPQDHKIVKYTGPMPGGKQPVPDITVLVRKPWPGALIESLPPAEPVKVAMSYIFRNHVQRGKFQPQRAKELGVEKGPKWAALGKGQNVENAKGETITPDMVLGASKQGGGAAIVDLPSSEYVEALVSRSEWKSSEIMAGVGAFIWMLGPGVASHPMLKQFMEEMKHMRHVVSSPELCSNRLSLDSAASATVRLSQIDPIRYNTPVHDNKSASQALESLGGLKDLVSIADRGQKIQLEPSIEVQDNEINTLLDADAVRAEMSKDVLDLAVKAREEVKAAKQELDAWADSLPQKDVEITTLGTGSALPSKYRNVSATLVRVPGWGSMLLDAGENTLGQLRRVYAPEVLDEIMRELRVIWISHMHADHHLGTVSVIREWYKVVHGSQRAAICSPADDADFDAGALFSNQDRLSVISESAMLHWLEEYSHVDDYGYSRLAPLCLTPNFPQKNIQSSLHWFIPPSSTQVRGGNSPRAREPWADKIARAKVLPQALNLQDIQCVQVQHCHGARAVSVTFPSGFKASYSGDCRPSKPFTQIGQGSTVCIHEATFDDELQGDAEAKNHTTTSEALSVALGMGAKACVLTHFSQRYQKVPVLEYTEGEDAIQSLETTGDEVMDISTSTDDEAEAPAVDAVAPQAEMATSVDATNAKKAAKHIKIKAGSDMKVCVAFDYMRVKVGQIAEMEKYTDTLVALFAEEESEENKPEPPKKKGKGGKTQRNN